MFPSLAPVPGSSGTGGLKPEPLEGDSLTQFIRALQNYFQSQGQSQVAQGQDITNTGVGGFNTASATLQPTVDYWTKLLSGDQGEMAKAIAPEANSISAQYDTAQRAAQTNLPRGGMAGAIGAGLPFAKAAQVGNLFSSLRPQAAAGLQNAAGLQGQFAQGVTGAGLGIGGLGQGLLGLGANTAITRRGQNAGVETNNISNLTRGLTSLLTGH